MSNRQINLFSERKILLPEIRYRHCYHRDDHLRRSRIHAADIYQQFQTEIVDRQIEYNDAYIPNKLPSTVQCRTGEGHVFIQPETRKQSDRKHYAQRSDMRRKCHKAQIQHTVPQHKVIHQKIQHPVQHHIARTAYAVPEKLLTAPTAERSIEPIYYFSYSQSEHIHLT